MIHHYIKIAWRQLLKHKTQYILSVLGIAIGLICFSIASYYIRRQFLDYTAWENSARIGMFATINPENGRDGISKQMLHTLLNDTTIGIEKIALCNQWNEANITFIKENGTETPFLCSISNINKDFPTVYSMRTLTGEIATIGSGKTLISEKCAKRVFGNENPIGKTLYFTKADTDTTKISYTTITAVVRDFPEGSKLESDLFFESFSTSPEKVYWGNSVTALLFETADVKVVNQRLKQLPNTVDTDHKSYIQIKTLYQDLVQSGNLFAGILIPFIASLVLIVAMINYLKLSIQSFYARTRELSLRKSLGANQRGLFAMLFIEQTILLAFTTLITYSLTEFILPPLYKLFPEGTIGDIKLSELFVQQLEYMLLLLIICTLITSIAIRRIKSLNIISGIRNNGGNKHQVRNFMLGVQLVICFFFIGAGLGNSLLARVMDEGRYQTLSDKECDSIWEVETYAPQLKGHEKEITARIQSLPGVEDITAIGNNGYQTFTLADSIRRQMFLEESGVNYATFMQLPVQGKYPQKDEIIVSQALSELIRQVQPQNTNIFTINDKSYRIVGTYKQLPFRSITGNESSSKDLYNAITILPKELERCFLIKSRAGQEEKVKTEIVSIIRERLPESIPFPIRSLKEKNFLFYGGADVLGYLFTTLSIICLLITVLGVYSAISLDTQSRQKEVAIRKINGAGPKVIISLFGKLYLRLLCISAVITFPLLYFTFLQLSDGFPPARQMINNPLLWLGILLIVSSLIAVTIGWKIRSISRLNPAEVIKRE